MYKSTQYGSKILRKLAGTFQVREERAFLSWAHHRDYPAAIIVRVFSEQVDATRCIHAYGRVLVLAKPPVELLHGLFTQALVFGALCGRLSSRASHS